MADDFEQGDRVVYIPGHAKGDRNHPDCERGTVSSANAHSVFVKFDAQLEKFGWYCTTPLGCNRQDLALIAKIDQAGVAEVFARAKWAWRQIAAEIERNDDDGRPILTARAGLRDALDEIVVRALAAQQEYADWLSEPVKYRFDADTAAPVEYRAVEEAPAEPKSEDVVEEIIAVLTPALAEVWGEGRRWARDGAGHQPIAASLGYDKCHRSE